MEKEDVWWLAGQIENLAISIRDSLKNGEDVSTEVDTHLVYTRLKSILELSNDGMNKLESKFKAL